MKHIKNIYAMSVVSLLLSASQLNGNAVTAEVSCGELVDKITILTIKSERINTRSKLKNVYTELESLNKVYNEHIGNRSDILELKNFLKKINEALWDIEDAIRVKERNKEFDDEFIQIARSVYITNDQRCSVKKEIDTILGSHITEEKSYEELI